MNVVVDEETKKKIAEFMKRAINTDPETIPTKIDTVEDLADYALYETSSIMNTLQEDSYMDAGYLLGQLNQILRLIAIGRSDIALALIDIRKEAAKHYREADEEESRHGRYLS